ncbi:DUF4167 domain-containing protein [Jhaorihella thermophila]|uniref:DUF4167 domain-containing protein n=1 Tax=Jhaorihella thermophila TaxID=488547 RepID=A0A1H5SPX2_9RHOB|nr:DUF4167 domain-containing protein [Jhaorihella thermophila]SEF52018.1 protein of unknown function [Jhaorihella thermophila]
MRSSKSRSRSKSNRNRPSGGNIINRVFESSGPEGKVRGTPQQIIEKYNQLARDAQLANNRVAAENFQQHAEHYQRLLNEAQREIEARREEQERQSRERQAERDRERLARQEREATQAAAAVDPSEAPQPTVLDVAEPVAEDTSGLVETPESKPRRSTRGRTRKTGAQTRKKDADPAPASEDKAPDTETPTGTGPDDAPQVAE